MSYHNIRQAEVAECGLMCLAIASSMLGAHLDTVALRRRISVSQRGLNLEEMIRIAGSLHMNARAVRCDIEEISELSCPAILHWNMNHFVVLERVSGSTVYVVDPARGRLRLGASELSEKFTGVALELHAAQAFVKKRERPAVNVSSFFTFDKNLISSAAQVIALSFVMQIYVLSMPFYIQMAVDEGVTRSDRDLVAAVALGFSLIVVFNTIAAVMRGMALSRVSALVSWSLSQRLFGHLVRLPLSWFHRRKLADVLTRFDSIGAIRELASSGLVVVLIDGALSILTVGMMIVFSPKLSIVVLSALTISTIIQLAAFPISLRTGSTALSASIAEQGHRIESLRAIQTIKAMAAEHEREADWYNKLLKSVRAEQSGQNQASVIKSLQDFVDSISYVAIVYLGTLQIMSGESTIGVLYGFIAYRSQFASRARGVVDYIINIKMLDMYTSRLSDIVTHPMERSRATIADHTLPTGGDVVLENVSFSYSHFDKPIIKNLSATIYEGEFTAIVGASGIGKSTLLKIISGLYPCSYGRVTLGGNDISSLDSSIFRRSLGTVMQDDELLSGSISENVALFSTSVDIARVWKCLELASLDSEVKSMTMGLDTQVGDLGCSLSGGQKQRVLLARALYRNPQILLLDEATSHLDEAREIQINKALSTLSITRIVIAHRRETIDAADRVLILDGTGLREHRAQSREHAD